MIVLNKTVSKKIYVGYKFAKVTIMNHKHSSSELENNPDINTLSLMNIYNKKPTIDYKTKMKDCTSFITKNNTIVENNDTYCYSIDNTHKDRLSSTGYCIDNNTLQCTENKTFSECANLKNNKDYLLSIKNKHSKEEEISLHYQFMKQNDILDKVPTLKYSDPSYGVNSWKSVNNNIVATKYCAWIKKNKPLEYTFISSICNTSNSQLETIKNEKNRINDEIVKSLNFFSPNESCPNEDQIKKIQKGACILDDQENCSDNKEFGEDYQTCMSKSTVTNEKIKKFYPNYTCSYVEKIKKLPKFKIRRNKLLCYRPKQKIRSNRIKKNICYDTKDEIYHYVKTGITLLDAKIEFGQNEKLLGFNYDRKNNSATFWKKKSDGKPPNVSGVRDIDQDIDVYIKDKSNSQETVNNESEINQKQKLFDDTINQYVKISTENKFLTCPKDTVYINNGKTCRKQDKTTCSLHDGSSSIERCYKYPLNTCEYPLKLDDCKKLSEKLKINFNETSEDKYFSGCQISDDKKNIYFKKPFSTNDEYIMTNKKCEDIPYYQKIESYSDCKNAAKKFRDITKMKQENIIINYGDRDPIYGDINFGSKNKDPKDMEGYNVSKANNNVSGCSIKGDTILYNSYCGETYRWYGWGSEEKNTIRCKQPTTEKVLCKKMNNARDKHNKYHNCNPDDYNEQKMRGRCGPKYKGQKCKLGKYCNESNGWCGTTDAHKNAQLSTRYDGKYPNFKACLESKEDGIPNNSSKSSKIDTIINIKNIKNEYKKLKEDYDKKLLKWENEWKNVNSYDDYVKKRCTEFKNKYNRYQKTFGMGNKYINCPATKDVNKCGTKKDYHFKFSKKYGYCIGIRPVWDKISEEYKKEKIIGFSDKISEEVDFTKLPGNQRKRIFFNWCH